jgi:2,4-didehydro-3-deoxy-L-rhamnonate hydrolase
MRLATLAGRAVVLEGEVALDVEVLTGGEFGPDTRSVLDSWDRARGAIAARTGAVAPIAYSVDELGPPVPEPRQVFAIGLNYVDHARETHQPIPDHPVVFTKFPSALTGPASPVELPSAGVDYEAELVAVVGRTARGIDETEGWDVLAGLMVGQDFSEREIQSRGPAPQYSLGKSFPGFAPTGPALVTVDELGDPGDLGIRSWIGDEVLQTSRTSQLIFSVPTLVAYLSSIVTLLPGDLIFTGTPGGVGNRRDPKRFLRPGEVLVTEIEGLGRLETPLVAGRRATA